MRKWLFGFIMVFMWIGFASFVYAADVEIGTIETGMSVPGYAFLIYTGRSDKVVEFYQTMGAPTPNTYLHPPLVNDTIGTVTKKKCLLLYQGDPLVFLPISWSRLKVYRRQL